MVYASINWNEDPGEDVDEMLLQVLAVITASGCSRCYTPFDEPAQNPLLDNPRFILGRFKSASALTPLTVGLAALPITFLVALCPEGTPFGCADSPRLDRARCMQVTG